MKVLRQQSGAAMFKRRIFILIIFSACSVITSCQESAEQHFKKVLDYEKAKELKSAIEELNLAVEKNPDYARAYLERGNIRVNPDYNFKMENLDNDDEASGLSIKDFTKAVLLDSNTAKDALTGRGTAYVKLMDYENAIKDFQLAFEIDTTDAQIIFSLPYIMVLADDMDGLKEFLDRVIEMYPDNSEYYYRRALHRFSSFYDETGGCEDLKLAKQLFNKEAKYMEPQLNKRIQQMIDIHCKQ